MHTTPDKARIEQFSDGVFAIAITLLALELHAPQLLSSSLAGGLRELRPLIPNILTFATSFLTIAIFWVNHRQLTQDIGLIRRRLVWMNVLHLLFITLIPFATGVIRENPDRSLAVMTYAFVLFAGSISFSILRYYIHRSVGETHIPLGRSLIGPIVYALAIAVAPSALPLSYALLPIPALLYFLPKKRTHPLGTSKE
ncbi:DUF1211 domain-containing protein [Candidatus Nomurabacteria bacterium]|nr:DUF1211 domain-containing protein [Candidatus Nomurabacteria bacterium]